MRKLESEFGDLCCVGCCLHEYFMFVGLEKKGGIATSLLSN